LRYGNQKVKINIDKNELKLDKQHTKKTKKKKKKKKKKKINLA